MERGMQIGAGLSAEVFAWGESQALKLFHANIPLEQVQHEAYVSQLVHELGLAVPRVDGVIELAGRTGILYERIVGDSMLRVFTTKPWRLGPFVRQLVSLQIDMHHLTCRELPSQRQKVQKAIAAESQLGGAVKEKLLCALQKLPDGEAVCHGDFHPDNVLLSAAGPMVIDWLTVTRGQPLADVARSALMARSPAFPPNMSPLEKAIIQVGRKLFHALYLQEYQRRQSVSRAQIEAWIPIQAAVRLGEGVPGEERWLLRLLGTWDKNQ